MDSKQTEFDKAYWASKPSEVRGLAAMDDQDQRTKRAAELATKGYTIDVPIAVWGWDPYLVMKLRSQFGYTWVPSALQPSVTMAPGLAVPGMVSYDPGNAPPGSIRVSTNAADYPPFDPPVSTPQTAATNDPVGIQSLGVLYLSTVGENYPDGAQFSDARGTFLKHLTFTPFGRCGYWERLG